MNRKLSTTFFNLRLFLEGLKRLRVIGLATAILALTASAVVPLVFWVDQGSYHNVVPYEIEAQLLCAPAGLVVLLAPFFFFVLFSFLQKRKESDFFHAIPYTRTCVYVSFVTAALAFIWAIQIACAITAGLLWGMIPGIVADMGSMIAYVGISLLAAAMLSAFMMLALTVSGTGSSCILLFGLFAGFVRVVAAIFMGCLESIDLLAANEMWSHSFFSPLWFLPINVIYYMGDPAESAVLLYSLPNILYSVAVTLAVFALAGLIYNRRKSEMAGNPAPGVRTQALFRIMFTTLPALLIPLLAYTGDADADVVLILVAAVLLVYFLYELITTKRPKNMLKAIPGLGIVVGACILFSILFCGYRSLVLYEDVTKDEVKTVSVESGGFQKYSYQGRIMETLRTDDSAIVEVVVNQLALSQKYEREGWESRPDGVNYWSRMSVTIHLKGGRSLRRSIVIDEAAQRDIGVRYTELDEVREVLYCLPSDSEISSGGAELGNRDVYCEYVHLEEAELEAVMAVFRREFATLSETEMMEVMSPSLVYDTRENYNDRDVILTLRGKTARGAHHNSDYYITDALPETRAYLIALLGVSQQEANYLDTAGQTYGGSTDSTLAALGQCAEDPAFTETFGYLKGNVVLVGLNRDGEGKDYDTTFYLAADDYTRLVELLREASLIHANTKPEGFTPSESTYLVSLRTDMESKYANMYLSLQGLFDLPPTVFKELTEILQIDP